MPVGTRTPPGTASGPQIAPRLTGEAYAELVTLETRSTVVKSGPATAAGIMEAVLTPVGFDVFVLIERIVVQTNSSTPTTARVYAGSVADENLIDFTGSGDIDVADELQPLHVAGALSTVVQWRGASAGAVGTARFQYRIVGRPGAEI